MRYLIVILFLSSSLYGQQIDITPNEESGVLDIASLSGVKSYGVETFDNRAKGVDGSVFLNDDWNTGSIKIANSKVYDQYTFKYNVLDQNIIIRMEDRFFALPGMFVEYFILEPKYGSLIQDNRKFIRKVGAEDSIYFLEVLVDGDYSLYKKHEINVKKAVYNPALDSGELKDKLVLKETYFLAFNNSMVEIPRKKRKFEKTMKEHSMIVEALKEDSNDFSDPIGLIGFVSNLNAVK